jgi:nucleoside-diphosphate-sugar epimerase
MNILISGGAGFIGSHLSDLLLEQGHQVVAIDNLSTGRLENVAHLRANPNYRLVVESVTNETVFDRFAAGSDHIFHLAAAVGVELIVQDPVGTIETNILGTEVVLKTAARYGTPVFIASTSEVYGKNENVPFDEDADMVFGATTRSRWCYACSKAIDEFLAIAYHSEKGLPVTIGRFFNTVGPRQTGQYGMVVPRFVGQALKNEPISVYGDGTQARCFCHVKDVVTAVVKMAPHPDAAGKIFNIGSDVILTINQLAEKVKAITGSSSEIQHVSYDDAYGPGFEDMHTRQPNIGRINELIGFEVTRDIDQIIRDVAEHMQKGG